MQFPKTMKRTFRDNLVICFVRYSEWARYAASNGDVWGARFWSRKSRDAWEALCDHDKFQREFKATKSYFDYA